MRRIIIFFTIISMGFFACEKDNNIEKKQVNSKRAGINSDMTELESNIRSFLNNIDNEAEGSLYMDSSIYYLEAGFNYCYSHSGQLVL